MIKRLYKKLLPEKKRILFRQSLQRLMSPLYHGNLFKCNCCNRDFRKFLPKGNVTRQNAECPFCSSLERTRVLDFYLERELGLYQAEGIKLLHFAPEYALFHKIKNIKNIEYMDADINPAYARHVVDITDIPFPTEYFDYVICSHVLGHVPDEATAVKELHRVLKTDGTALVLTLLSGKDKTFEDSHVSTPDAKLKHYGEPDLCRLHGNDFAERLQAGGFVVEGIDYRGHLSNEMQATYSLGNGEREKIFKCTKSIHRAPLRSGNKSKAHVRTDTSPPDAGRNCG